MSEVDGLYPGSEIAMIAIQRSNFRGGIPYSIRETLRFEESSSFAGKAHVRQWLVVVSHPCTICLCECVFLDYSWFVRSSHLQPKSVVSEAYGNCFGAQRNPSRSFIPRRRIKMANRCNHQTFMPSVAWQTSSPGMCCSQVTIMHDCGTSPPLIK